MSTTVASSEAIIIFLMLIIYMVMGTFLEKVHSPFGHEASLVVILGALISYIAYANDMYPYL